MAPSESSSIPDRVLIVRPSALGDVCRTVPVLASLRAAWPDADIDWVVNEEYAPAIAAHPALTNVVPFPRRRFHRWWIPSVGLAALGWMRDLRRRDYDLVIDGQGLGRSGLITWCTRAPRRVGEAGAREMAWLAYNRRHRLEARHTVDRMLGLLAAEGIEPIPDTRLYVADDDRRWWAEERAGLGRYAVLAATARWASKRWPEARWRDLVAPLRERGYERAVLIGAPGEADQVRDLERTEGVTSLVGRASLGRTMAVIAAADLVVAHDSAPLHMAVGFDRPCVALFGPTDPATVGPYGRPEAVVRAPLDAGETPNYRDRRATPLMERIAVDAVVERIDAVQEQPA